MRRTFFTLALFCALPCWASSAQTADQSAASQQNSYSSYYVHKGDVLEAVDGDPARAAYTEWQVWLYPQKVRVSWLGVGLAYARWGLSKGHRPGQ